MMISRIVCLAAGALAAVVGAPMAEGQLFADFQTSMGPLSIELFYREAPRTVANFISLAQGTRPWMDPRNNHPRSGVPFYNGQIFHRVINNPLGSLQILQAGSPTQTGADSIGCVIPDEIARDSNTGAVIKTHLTGVISMANTGAAHSGAAQFFLTFGPAAHLNGRHTVFGEVAAGPGGAYTKADSLARVTEIGGVPTWVGAPTDTGQAGRPKTDVVIQSITFRAVGAEAQAFQPLAWALPQVTGPLGVWMSREQIPPDLAPVMRLRYATMRGIQYRLYGSDTLQEWTYFGASNIQTLTDPDYAIRIEGGLLGPGQRFFQWMSTDYRELVAASFPPIADDRVISLFFAGRIMQLRLQRSAADPVHGGTWQSLSSATGTINGTLASTSYAQGQSSLAAWLSPVLTVVFTTPFGGQFTNMRASLTFSAQSATQGSFSASLTGPAGVSGTDVGSFLINPPTPPL
jgi:cyclophilin family peptidyl-prolyl cis-trans isomerase